MTLRDPFGWGRPWYDQPLRRRWPGPEPAPVPRNVPWRRRAVAPRTPWSEPEPLAEVEPPVERGPAARPVPVERRTVPEAPPSQPVPSTHEERDESPGAEVDAGEAVVPPGDEPSTPESPSPTVPAAPSGPGERDKLREALQELAAAKQRVERDAQRVKDGTREALVVDLLPVLDNLDRSLEVQSADQALHEGVKLVRGQLEQVLMGYGLERITSVGRPFDPAQHEAVAVMEVDAESDDGVVQAEWQAGYRFGDKVLRASKVSVGKLGAGASVDPASAAE